MVGINNTFSGSSLLVIKITWWNIISNLSLAQVVFAGAATLLVGYLTRQPSNCGLSLRQVIALLAIAAVIIVGACGPVGLTQKYINWAKLGEPAYVCSSYAYFGVVIIVTTILLSLATWLRNSHLPYRYFRYYLMLSTLIVALVSSHFNTQVSMTMRLNGEKWHVFDQMMHVREFIPLFERQRIWAPQLYTYCWYACIYDENYWGIFSQLHYGVKMETCRKPASHAKLLNYMPLSPHHGYVFYLTEQLDANSLPKTLDLCIMPKRTLTMTYTSMDGKQHAVRLDRSTNCAADSSPYYFYHYSDPACINYFTLRFKE